MPAEDITLEKNHHAWQNKASRGDLSIEEVNDTETFRSLRGVWNTLLQESGDNNIFLTWEYLFTWWQHYGGDKKLKILLIKKSDKIIGIAPFMHSRYRQGFIGVDVLETLCSINCDYSGIILTERKDESVAILLDYLEKVIRENNVIIRMAYLPEDSGFLNVLRKQRQAFPGSLFLEERPIDSCPYLLLPATWEEYLRTLSKKRRGNLRRAKQFLQDNYTVEFEKFGSQDNLHDKLQTVFELHRKRWRLKEIKSKFTESKARAFYEDLSEAFYRNKWLDLSFLKLDGRPVSVCWGFVYHQVFYYETIAFDPGYAKHSVGTVHTMKLIENAIQNGLRKFDFLTGAEIYKSYWTSCSSISSQILISKRGISGRYQLKLLYLLTKLTNIRSRSLRENYHRYLENRRQKRK